MDAMSAIPHPKRDHGAILLALISMLVYWACRSPFAGQWDSFDYLKQIVTHRLSDLGFGRPVFVGCNIAVWEIVRRVFGLPAESVEHVAMAGVVLTGVAGVLLFRRLGIRILGLRAGRLAAMAFLLSPVYAVYAGYVMTEVPMLAAALAAAVMLCPDGEAVSPARSIAAGFFFGAAIGIREQAVALGPALLWILLQGDIPRLRARRREDPASPRSGLSFPVSALLFGLSATIVGGAPVLILYLADPAAFAERMRLLKQAIPTGAEHLGANLMATAVYGALTAPAALMALSGAALLRHRNVRGTAESNPGPRFPLAGAFCGIILPLALLSRDADVQIHPRYTLVALPAIILVSARLYDRWMPGARAAAVWGLLNIGVFAASQFAVQPFRSMQTEKKAYARSVLDHAPLDALLIAGAYSPVFDYYRAIGVRPDWKILWSGWGWSADSAAARVSAARGERRPILLCDGPWAWLYFEDERLDLHRLFSNCRTDEISPGLREISSQFTAPVRSGSRN
jgi:hypothetical protein